MKLRIGPSEQPVGPLVAGVTFGRACDGAGSLGMISIALDAPLDWRGLHRRARACGSNSPMAAVWASMDAVLYCCSSAATWACRATMADAWVWACARATCCRRALCEVSYAA